MRIGLWWFHPYTLRVVAGLLAALGWLWWRAPRQGFARQQVIAWGWALAVVALLCGRLGYVLGNSAYFAQHPAAILRLDRVGGLHGGSACAGGLLVVLAWARAERTCLDAALALLTPAVLCVAAGAWWGCAMAGCAWGREAWGVPSWARWLVVEAPDIYHVVAPRYAVQGLGAVWALVMAILAVGWRPRSGVALALYFAGSAGLTFLRDDLVPRMGTLRSDFVLDLALAATLLLIPLAVRQSRVRHS